MNYILVQGNDFKTMQIGKELKKRGIKLIPIGSSPIKLPLYIIMYLLKYGRPSAVIYRYLNDYPSFVKTIIRTLSEIVGVIITFALNIKMVWICHNVDRESHMYYPVLTSFRRWIFKYFSKKILVTDPLLVKYAKRHFPKQKSKIDNITFGTYLGVNKSSSAQKVVETIKEFVHFHNGEKTNDLYGFVAGNINWKTSQFAKVPEMIDEAEKRGYNLKFIVIGPIGSFLTKNDKKLYLKLKEDSRILFLDGYHELDLDQISIYVDFYWRVYLDLSTPATIYESAYYKKPIVTQKKGFLGEAVSTYSLGYVVNSNYTNLPSILNEIPKWNPIGAETFLKTHNWEKAAIKIYEIISK